MIKPIHTMIRVLNKERSISFYEQALRLKIKDDLVFDNFTLVYMQGDSSTFELELTINHDRTEPYNLGDGYGHLAFAVDDIDAEHARLKAQGFEPRDIVSFDREGSLLAKFFFVADPDGYQIEILQSHGRYK